jgi:peptidoglycan glycosyltransferase
MRSHGTQDLTQAFRNSCNCAFAQIADQLGGQTLEEYAQLLGITQSVSFDGVTSAGGNIQANGEEPHQVAWSAIGQHKDQINPCRFMMLMGAIANGGTGAVPYLVEQIDGGKWGTYQAQTAMESIALSQQTIEALQAMMRNNVQNSYGDENFPGLLVCAKSGTAQVGGGQEDNAMFAGFVADDEYPLAFIVVVENGGFGRSACVPILSQVLATCKQIMDKE